MQNYKGYDYEIDETGYFIYQNGKKWIDQHEPFIPNRSISYEENAKKQIDDIIEASSQPVVDPLQEQVEELQLAVAELGEIIGGN